MKYKSFKRSYYILSNIAFYGGFSFMLKDKINGVVYVKYQALLLSVIFFELPVFAFYAIHI